MLTTWQQSSRVMYSPIYLPTRLIFAEVFLTLSSLCSRLLISPKNLLISQWHKSNWCFSANVWDIQTARLRCCWTSYPNPEAELSVSKRPFLLTKLLLSPLSLFFSWRSTWQWWLLNNHTLSHNINRKVITPQPNASRHALQQSFMWHYRRARPRGKGMVVGSIKQWTVTQETTVSIKILTTYQRGVFHVYYCNHDDKGPLSLMKK